MEATRELKECYFCPFDTNNPLSTTEKEPETIKLYKESCPIPSAESILPKRQAGILRLSQPWHP